MRTDKFYDSYSRKVDDVLTYFGDIGGLAEALFGFGMVVVGFLAQKMFMSKIVKKIYHIRKYDNLDHEIKRKKSLESHLPTLNDSLDHQNELTNVKDKESHLSKEFKTK